MSAGEPQRDSSAGRGDLESRVVELEVRLAFQEHVIGELSDALAASRIETERHAQQLGRALDELSRGSSEASADPAHEPPPPHY